MARRKNISVDIQLESKNSLATKLKNLLEEVKKQSTIKIDVDTKSAEVKLKALSTELTKIQSQIFNAFNSSASLQGYVNKVSQVTNAYEKQSEAIKEIANLSKQKRVFSSKDGGETKELVKDVNELNVGLGRTIQLTQHYKSGILTIGETSNFAAIEKQISSLQEKLNVSKNNMFIDSSVIDELQNKLNSVNTNTVDSEFKELQFTINNLASGDSGIVKVQNQITNMKNNLNSMKGKYKNLVGDKDSKEQLIAYENELLKLQNILRDLKSGKSFDSKKITSELNKAKHANVELKNAVLQSSKALRLSQKDAETSGEAIKRSLTNVGIYASSAMVIRELVQGLRNASEYIIEIDKRFTNIQMITGMTMEEVKSITSDFGEIGDALHTTNKEMMAGAEELLRAGYSVEEAKKMMSSSILGAKISGQDVGTTSEQLIAVKNAFAMTGDEIEHVIDVVTKLDNTSATSFAEITEATKRTAFSARQAGTDFDTLATYITTVSEATRKSSETIGESFKSMYSRYSNIKLGRLDEDGKGINDLEVALKRINVDLRDSQGNFKDFDDVLNDVYDTMIKTGKSTKDIDYRSVIQALGGTRQRETVLALLDNMELVKKHQDDVANSAGNARRMFDEAYDESLDAKLNDLQRSFEGMYESMLNSDVLGSSIELLTTLVSCFGDLNTIAAITIASLGMFKGKAIMGMLSSLSGLISSFGVLGAAITSVQLAYMKLMSVMYSNPIAVLGVVAAVILAGFKAIRNEIDRTKKELQDFNNNVPSSFETDNKSLATAEKLLNNKKDLEKQIANADANGKNNLALKKELLEIERQLSDALPATTTGYDEQGNAIASNTELIEAEIDLKRQQMEINAKEVLSKNESVNATKENVSAIKENIKAMELAKAKGEEYVDGGWNTVMTDGSVSKGTGKIHVDTNYNKQTKKLQEYEGSLKAVRLAILQLRELGVNDEEIGVAFGIKADEVEEYSKALVNNTDTANTNSDAQGNLGQALNGLSEDVTSTTENLKSLSSEFDLLSGKIGIIDKIIKEVQEYGGLQESTMSTILSKYPELLEYYTAEGWQLDQLQKKQIEIRNQREETLRQAVKCVNGEVNAEVQGSNIKLKAHRDYVNQVLSDQTQWANAMSGIYDTDKRNYLNSLKGKIDGLKTQLNAMASSSMDSGEFLRKLDLLERYEARLSHDLASSATDTPKIAVPTIVGGNVSGTSSSNKSEVADLDLVIDRYYKLNNVIEHLNSTLGLYEERLKYATGKAYVDIIKAQIDIYNKQKEAISAKNNEMKKEQTELSKLLKQNGFLFDSLGNITNATERLSQLEVSANAKSGKAKEEAIRQVKELQKAMEVYAKLTFTDIPEMNKEWEELNNIIKETKMEMLDLVSEQEKNVADLIEYKLQQVVDKQTKALNNLKDKFSKVWEEEDYQDELNDKKNNLADLYTQMQEALRSGNTILAENLKKEYQEAQKELNNLINQQDRNDITEKIDDKITSLDDALQEALKPENINKLIEEGLKSGYIQLGDEIINVSDAMNEMLKNTTVGFETAGLAMKDFISEWEKVAEIVKDIDKLNGDVGVTIDKNIGNRNGVLVEPSQLSKVSPNTTNKSVVLNVDASNLVKVESLNNTTLEQVEDVVDTQINKLTDKLTDIMQGS